MTDKTLGAYQRTTPDPDVTMGGVLARLQAEMTRLLDEADAELRDEADGGVAAALIEQEDGVDAAASRLAAFARKFGVPPKWTTAPAVQAWHRSDHRTEHDGTPGQPRIWSPDHKTTETWSTPSLRNVHWSDLVDVTPLAPVRGCPDSEQHDDGLPDAVDALTKAVNDLHKRAEKAEQERDAWHEVARRATRRARRDAQLIPAYARLDLWVALGNDSTEFETIDPDWAELNAAVREAQAEALRAAESRPLTPDAITGAMAARAMLVLAKHGYRPGHTITHEALTAALTEPPARPEGAEEIERLLTEDLGDFRPPVTPEAIADLLASRGVRAARRDEEKR